MFNFFKPKPDKSLDDRIEYAARKLDEAYEKEDLDSAGEWDYEWRRLRKQKAEQEGWWD